MRQKKNKSANADEQCLVAINRLKELEEEMRKYANTNDEFVKDLLTDLTGQVQEAISREDWFTKWGLHFLPSLTRKLRKLLQNSFLVHNANDCHKF